MSAKTAMDIIVILFLAITIIAIVRLILIDNNWYGAAMLIGGASWTYYEYKERSEAADE